jgi:hypothetical protein
VRRSADRSADDLDAPGIWRLLAHGGLARPASRQASREANAPRIVQIPKYNGLADPGGAEQLGRWLARRAQNFGPSVVLLWEDPQDIVLGHVVARELGAVSVRSYNADGLVDLADPLPRGSRVLLLIDAFREPGLVRAMRAIAERHGASVVAIAVLVDTDALAAAGEPTAPVVSLVSLRGYASIEAADEEVGGDGTR